MTEPTSEPSPESQPAPEADSHAETLVVLRIFDVLKLAGSVKESAVALVGLADRLRRDGDYRTARDVAELVAHTLTQELLLREMFAREAMRKELHADNEKIIDTIAMQLREMAKEDAGETEPERRLAVVPTQTIEVGRVRHDVFDPPGGPPAPADRRRGGWVDVVPGTLARVVGGTLRGLHVGDVVLRWPEPVNGQTGTWIVFQGQPTHQSLPSWGWMPQDNVPWGKDLQLEMLAENLDQRQCGDPAGLLRMYGG